MMFLPATSSSEENFVSPSEKTVKFAFRSGSPSFSAKAPPSSIDAGPGRTSFSDTMLRIAPISWIFNGLRFFDSPGRRREKLRSLPAGEEIVSHGPSLPRVQRRNSDVRRSDKEVRVQELRSVPHKGPAIRCEVQGQDPSGRREEKEV